MEQSLFCKTFTFRTIFLTAHRHNDNAQGIPCHFVARMRSGTGLIRALSGEELSLRAGDIFYLPMGLAYHSYWTPDEAGSVSWDSYGFTHLPVQNKARYAMQKIEPIEKALLWLDALSQDQTVSPASVGYLYLFLAEVIPFLRTVKRDPKQALLQAALDHMQENESVSVPELARACGISESGLYALFRDYAHASPVQIKHRLLCEHAVRLLSTTDMTVERIADALGLCSAAHLRKILKKQTGRTPAELRKEAKFI